MSPAVRMAFILGAIAACAAAATGILLYYSHPSGDFYLLGWDELQHRQFAEILLRGGDSGNIFENALEGEALTGDATWGTGLVIGLSTYFFGTDLSYIAVKCVLHLWATLLLYQLIAKYRGERVATYVALFFLIYPPLLVYEATFLKDDLVAALVVFAAVLIDRRRYVLMLLPLALLVVVRANAVLFPIILIGYLWHARISRMVLLSVVPLAIAVALIPQHFFERMLDVLTLAPGTVLFFIIKFLLGPLPTNILNYDTEAVLIFPWYALTFAGILAGFIFPEFWSSVRRNFWWIVMLLCVSLAPYLPYVNELDIIGPRQFAAVGWLYFLLFYERLLARYGFTLSAPEAMERRWQPAT